MEKSLAVSGGIKWFHWVALVGFGLVAGLLTIIIINTRPHTAAGTEEKRVAAAVARHVILPSDETPALATVTDPTKLTNNRLLSQAKQGDKILIYAKWKQAIIYRPSSDRVVDIGPVDVAAPGGDTGSYTPLK